MRLAEFFWDVCKCAWTGAAEAMTIYVPPDSASEPTTWLVLHWIASERRGPRGG